MDGTDYVPDTAFKQPGPTATVAGRKTYRLGFSRPPLAVEDLPTPEEVFHARKIGLEEFLLLGLGPAIIGLGLAIGRGEWLSAPLAVSQYGFQGVGWIILASAVLQVLYLVELGRYTLATGETPILGFGRVWPGWWLWTPLALIGLYGVFILGSWIVDAGNSLFALFNGRIATTPIEIEAVRLMGIGLLLTTFLFTIIGQKIERTLEAVMGILMIFVLVSLIIVPMTIVPAEYGIKAWGSLLTPAWLPDTPALASLQGLEKFRAVAKEIGSLAGFTALASGLNFMLIGYYRDKGYGMGHKVGYISGILGGTATPVSPVGITFPDTTQNRKTWKRWFRFLQTDLWAIFFVGSLLGLMAPSILVAYLASTNPPLGLPTQENILIYAAQVLGQRFGPLLYGWALLVGFFILYTTQILVLELLTRNMADAVYGLSNRVRQWTGQDIRKVYYPWMVVLIVVISIIIHLFTPAQVSRGAAFAANFSNLAAMVFPLLMIYLNFRLPRPARPKWWSVLALVGNAVFFGIFFVNFVIGSLPK